MSLFILDTDTLSLLQDGHPVVVQNVSSHERVDDVVITAITLEEQLAGWHRLLRQAKTRDRVARAYRELVATVQFVGVRQILQFDLAAILRYESLLKMRLNVRKNDLRIAAIALETAGTVVTRNLRDFQRVPGLLCVDWSV